MTFFIYFTLVAEVFIFVGALLMFFLPGNIAAWASVFFFIAEFPFLASKQIVIIISDTAGVSYSTFGVPLLYLSPFLYFFLAWTFIGVENLFEKSGKEGPLRRLGRRLTRKQ